MEWCLRCFPQTRSAKKNEFKLGSSNFKIVFLWFTPDQHIEAAVDILGTLAGQLHVLPVLVAVEQHPPSAGAGVELRLGLVAKLLDHPTVFIQHPLHLAQRANNFNHFLRVH